MKNKYKKPTRLEVRDFVYKHFFSVKELKNEFLVECPFEEHEYDFKSPAFYIRNDGVFFCHKCQAKGNLITLYKHLHTEKLIWI